MTTSPAPWNQKDDTRPVYDANGHVVNFTENAPRIVAAVNFHRVAIVLLERLRDAIVAATGPNATAEDTARLLAQAKIADALVKVGMRE